MMTDDTKRYKGEEHIMYLCKTSRTPLLDICVFQLRQENYNRSKHFGTELLSFSERQTVIMLELSVFGNLIQEMRNAGIFVNASLSSGFRFDGMTFTPFFTTEESSASHWGRSLLMIQNLQGKFHGL